jgi:hypothetical protein
VSAGGDPHVRSDERRTGKECSEASVGRLPRKNPLAAPAVLVIQPASTFQQASIPLIPNLKGSVAGDRVAQHHKNQIITMTTTIMITP